MRKVAFLYDDEVLNYDFGKRHPLRPERVKYTVDLLLEYGVIAEKDFLKPRYATKEELLTAHDEQFLYVVDRLSGGDIVPMQWEYGFGSTDNPPFIGMYEAAALYCGASIQAAEIIMDDPSTIGYNPAGGLHHARKSRASGFCIFNDAVMAIHHLLKKYKKVCYIDIDVHHGDGVQWAFWYDPRVLTVSVHESGKWLFPGTGDADEIGADDGLGYSLNLPFAPQTPDDVWLNSFDEAVMPIVKAFEPDAVFLQTGGDPHYLDVIGHLGMTVQGWTEAVKRIVDLEKPLIVVGGGGYNLQTVPRMWASAYAVLADITLNDTLPINFAKQHDLTTLTDHSRIELREEERRLVEEFAYTQVQEIKSLLFPRFGL